MIRFECDYAEGAHDAILKRMIETNYEQTPGYGVDSHCQNAAELIKKECGRSDVDVHFIVGGTQTNTIALAAILKPYQGAISAVTGHIACHETGAIEATGHKVLTVPSEDGKITAEQIIQLYNEHCQDASKEHTVQPGAVYISHPTENGTTYTKQELIQISEASKQCGLPLFVDGARLGYGIMAPDSDITIKDLAQYSDTFYIGGTKVGALFGEALVITNNDMKKDFRYYIKRHGAMLAKGRLLGIQFETLFENGLYYDISKYAIELAMQIKNAFEANGYKFIYNSNTNQQFPILPNNVMQKLAEKYSFTNWAKIDDNHTAVRFCTSWATKKENVEALIADLNSI